MSKRGRYSAERKREIRRTVNATLVGHYLVRSKIPCVSAMNASRGM